MTETDDASVASDSSSIFILAQQTDRKPIDPGFLLLGSQSMVNLFSDPNLVNNVHQATTPINVHCNKGTMPTTAVADFGINEVYLNPDGIANVLSLFALGQKTSRMTAKIVVGYLKFTLRRGSLNLHRPTKVSMPLISRRIPRLLISLSHLPNLPMAIFKLILSVPILNGLPRSKSNEPTLLVA